MTTLFHRRHRFPLRPMLLGLAVALLLAASPQASHAVLVATGTTPARYALGVSPDIAEIWCFFNNPLAPVSAASVRVAGSMSGIHTGQVITADNVIIFRNESGPFFRGEMVHVNYKNNIAAMGTGDPLTGGFYFAFTISSAAATAPWSRRIAYHAEIVPYFIYGGDIDNNGTPDVAAPNEGTDNVSVFLNTGGLGDFSVHANYGVGDVPSCVFGEDFDNDGDQDLATADINSGTVSVLRNNGNGTFAPRQVLTAGPTCRQVWGGDFDGDNDIDLCATAFGNQRIFIYLNPGNGVFPAGTAFTDVSPGPFGIRTGDFNLDGHLDIAVACRTANNINILTNNGTGGFTRTNSPASGSWPWDIGVNDMDGDHDADIVIVAANGNQVVVHFNSGTGTFSTTHAVSTGLFPLGVHIADLDGDGDCDVTSSNYTGASVGVYSNPGNGMIALQQTLGTIAAGSYSWAHDLDGDGDLDLSVVDESANWLFIFYRGTETTDVASRPAPATPAGAALAVAQNSPNPFRPETSFAFSLARAGHVRVGVYDPAGTLVAELVDQEMPAGDHVATWRGRDADGNVAAPGVYFYRVEGLGETYTGKMALLR